MKNKPDFTNEALLWEQGCAFVFGIDEAGRGCLAGPVCAAVAAWAPGTLACDHEYLRDSKAMSEKQREEAFPLVQKNAAFSGVGFASAEEIDRWNILRATYLAVARAMESALRAMKVQGVENSKLGFLSDGSHPLLSNSRQFVFFPEYKAEFPLLQKLMANQLLEKCIVKGDSKVSSISGASILAKVSRDHLMQRLDSDFPHYEFALHKGYSTPRHIELLREKGPCIEHRRSFSPVREALALFPS